MLCTYVYLRIDIDLSTPLLRDEHNSHANFMQQMLQNSSENELIFFASPPLSYRRVFEAPRSGDKICMQAELSMLTAKRVDHGMHVEY